MSLIDEYGIDQLVCIHGHRYNDRHNSCFAKGLVRPIKNAKRLSNTWYSKEGLKIGYLDIESDGLRADFSTMLSWCIKNRDGDIYSDVIKKEELFTGVFDRNLVESCINEMTRYDILVTYNGTNFDIPYLRAKAFHYGLPFPQFILEEKIKKDGSVKYKASPTLYHFDLYFTVKSKFCITRKSLDNICDYLGIEGKTPLDKETWRRAKYGDPEAIKGVLEHNEGDVVILEELHKRIEGLSRWDKKGL